MSLAEKEVGPVAGTSARKAGRPGDRVARWVGPALIAAGLVMMWPATTDALSLGSVQGSSAAETLRGTSRGEELVAHGGSDELYGGPGRDVLYAGSGNDFVESGDGERDLVHCGRGHDTVSADGSDLVSRDCETVFTG